MIIQHPVFTSIHQARTYYRVRRSGATPRFAAQIVHAKLTLIKR